MVEYDLSYKFFFLGNYKLISRVSIKIGITWYHRQIKDVNPRIGLKSHIRRETKC